MRAARVTGGRSENSDGSGRARDRRVLAMRNEAGDRGLVELRRLGAAVRVALVDGRIVLTGELPRGGPGTRRACVEGDADAWDHMIVQLRAALGVGDGAGEGMWAA